MDISYDNHAEGYDASGPNTTISFTNAGNYLFAVTPVSYTTLTFNGVSASVLQDWTPNGSPFGGNCPPIRVWGLANPYIGTANIVTNGYTNKISCASYFGVNPSDVQPESSNYVDSSAGQQTGTYTNATVTKEGGWIIGFTRYADYRTVNGQSGTTIRSNACGNLFSDGSAIFDLNSSKTAGTYSSGVDLSSSSTFFTMIVMAISPKPPFVGQMNIL